MRNVVRDVRLVGLVEGVSFLVLLGVAMPLKYLLGFPWAVTVVGGLHGFLFIAYVALVGRAAWVRRWGAGRTLLALAASVVPAGPFLLDSSLRREELTLAPSLGEPGESTPDRVIR